MSEDVEVRCRGTSPHGGSRGAPAVGAAAAVDGEHLGPEDRELAATGTTALVLAAVAPVGEHGSAGRVASQPAHEPSRRLAAKPGDA